MMRGQWRFLCSIMIFCLVLFTYVSVFSGMDGMDGVLQVGVFLLSRYRQGSMNYCYCSCYRYYSCCDQACNYYPSTKDGLAYSNRFRRESIFFVQQYRI